MAVDVMCIFLVVPWVGLWSVIVAFSVHISCFLNSVNSYFRTT